MNRKPQFVQAWLRALHNSKSWGKGFALVLMVRALWHLKGRDSKPKFPLRNLWMALYWNWSMSSFWYSFNNNDNEALIIFLLNSPITEISTTFCLFFCVIPFIANKEGSFDWLTHTVSKSLKLRHWNVVHLLYLSSSTSPPSPER